MLAFALAGTVHAQQQVYMNLYSDAFIAENAFQGQSNEVPFDLRRTELAPHVGNPALTLEPEDNVLQIDAATAKKRMSKSMDLGMDLPLIKPGRVDQPYQAPYTDPGLYIPGTMWHEPSVKPKDDPTEKPTG